VTDDGRATADPPAAGLCHTCRHARLVVSARGSTFTLCRLARVDPRFPKYPALPVTACDGWQARPPDVAP
jgi:hypothetical protein